MIVTYENHLHRVVIRKRYSDRSLQVANVVLPQLASLRSSDSSNYAFLELIFLCAFRSVIFQETLGCSHQRHRIQPTPGTPLFSSSFPPFSFLGAIQLGSRGCVRAFGLSIAIRNVSSMQVDSASLPEFSHKDPVDITGAAFAFMFFFSDPAALSLSEPFSAGAELFGCLNLQSFPFLQAPCFQNEHMPSFLVGAFPRQRIAALGALTFSCIRACKNSSDGCICNRSPSCTSHEGNETDMDCSSFHQAKDPWSYTAAWPSPLASSCQEGPVPNPGRPALPALPLVWALVQRVSQLFPLREDNLLCVRKLSNTMSIICLAFMPFPTLIDFTRLISSGIDRPTHAYHQFAINTSESTAAIGHSLDTDTRAKSLCNADQTSLSGSPRPTRTFDIIFPRSDADRLCLLS